MKISNRIFGNPDVGSYYHRAAVRYLDSAATSLPSSSPLMADGKALAEDDRVLFTALSNAAHNNRIYKVVKVAGQLSLALASDGRNPNGDSTAGDTVLVKDGSHLGELWSYEGSWQELDVDIDAEDDYTPANPPPASEGNVAVIRYEYDFAVDGGAVGVIDLWDKVGYDIIPAGTYILSQYRAVLTQPTTATSSQISFGFESDPTAFMSAQDAATVQNGSQQYDFVAESSGWPIGYSRPVFTIAGAPLTGGKIAFMFLAIPAATVSG